MTDKAYQALFPDGDDDANLPVVASCNCCFDRPPAPQPESRRDREPLRRSPRRLTTFLKNRSKR